MLGASVVPLCIQGLEAPEPWCEDQCSHARSRHHFFLRLNPQFQASDGSRRGMPSALARLGPTRPYRVAACVSDLVHPCKIEPANQVGGHFNI